MMPLIILAALVAIPTVGILCTHVSIERELAREEREAAGAGSTDSKVERVETARESLR